MPDSMSKLRTGAAVKMVDQRHLCVGEITTHPFKWVFERKRQPEPKLRSSVNKFNCGNDLLPGQII